MPSNIQVLPLNLAVEVEEERGHTSTISQLLGTNIAMVLGFQVECLITIFISSEQ